MRTLLILTKRQIADDAVYLIPSLVLSAVFALGVSVAVLTDEFTGPSGYTIALFGLLPTLLSIGACVLGIVQARTDQASGMTDLLRVQRVTHAQILAARMIVGVLVILGALLPLGAAGTILWELKGPPDWLVRDWVADVFLGMFMVCLASYCFGLHAGARAGTFARAVGILIVMPLLVLLVVIKGFGWPLLAVLGVLVGSLLLRLTRSRPSTSTFIMASGFSVLLFFLIPLFCVRHYCDTLVAAGMLDRNVDIGRSGLLIPGTESDPNVDGEMGVDATLRSWYGDERLTRNLVSRIRRGFLRPLAWSLREGRHLTRELGIVDYFRSRKRGSRFSQMVDVLSLGHSLYRGIHLDSVDGCLVYRRAAKAGEAAEFDWDTGATLFAGPNGVSATTADSLDRFLSPSIGCVGSRCGYLWSSFSTTSAVVCDKTRRQCFSIDFEERSVRQGPVWSDGRFQPARIGSTDGTASFWIDLEAPKDKRGNNLARFVELGLLPMVDESGRIDLFDSGTCEISRGVAALPRPKTICGLGRTKPHDVLDFEVRVIAVAPPRRWGSWTSASQAEVKKHEFASKFLGIAAATLSRQGTSIALAVFDRDGKRVKTEHSEGGVAPGPVFAVGWTAAKYLVESLHPPVLGLASFFTAYSFEAGATHRAVFLMPNSFVALQRDRQTNLFFQFLWALLFLVPGLLFAGCLGWRIVKDARRIGLSRRSRRLWFLGTLAFGLPAYITYRQSRPRVALLRCRNCGNLRRADMDLCHHCRTEWDVPALTAPPWRVTDGLQ